MAWTKTANIQGPTGPASVTWRSVWSSATVYAVRDGVTRLGSSYVAMVANTNVDPSTDGTGKWLLLASKGDTGATGATPPLSTATPQPLGTAGPGSGTNASKDGHIHSSTIAALVASGSFTLGGGSAHGTNYAQLFRTAIFNLSVSGTWYDIPWTSNSGVADDGVVGGTGAAAIILPTVGLWFGVATVTFTSTGPNTNGLQALTGGGGILAEHTSLTEGVLTLPFMVPVATANYQITIQAMTTSGNNLTIRNNTSTTPCIVRLCQVA